MTVMGWPGRLRGRSWILEVIANKSDSKAEKDYLLELKEYLDNNSMPDENKLRVAHWIHRCDDRFDWLECSGCGYGSDGEVQYGKGTLFCPYCGRQMEKEG